MGLASSIGLGLAMAQPDRRVVVLDGDGSLLMNLGSLATIGWVKPDESRRDRLGQRAVRHDRRTGHGDGAWRGSRGRRARDGHSRRDDGEDAGGAGSGDGANARGSRARGSSSPRSARTRPPVKPPQDCVFIKQRFMAAIGAPEGGTIGGPA